MKISYLGHATYYVELKNGAKVLIDPLLTDTFQDGTARVWPPRSVNVSALPRPDMIVITHCHPGHLEAESLSFLDKNIPVYHPADPTIERTLQLLGFKNVAVIGHGDTLDMGDVRCVFTGTVSDITEIGVLFQEPDSSFWYLADSEISDSIAQDVYKIVDGKLDLMITSYAAYNNDFFTHFRYEFPAQDIAFFLEQVLKFEPKILSANFIGLKYTGDGEWMNRYMFPTQPQQFYKDVAAFAKKVEHYLNLVPGCQIALENGTHNVRENALPYLMPEKGTSEDLLLDPTKSIPELRDPDIHRVGTPELKQRITTLLTKDFSFWVRESVIDGYEPIMTYHRLGVKFRIRVVYPDNSEDVYMMDMSSNSAAIIPDPDVGSYADITMRAAASVLDLWNRAEIPYYRAYHHIRAYSAIYRLMTSLDRRVEVAMLDGSDKSHSRIKMDGRDPLSLYFNHDVEKFYHPWLQKQLSRYQGIDYAEAV
ncbi:MAG: hypothetical protein DI551_06910 [Micavibrio aeruginosavorus]|uniref:Metallo-beta-lactamase domain-containing protein n=1 Tax=Micavibrio aeruginosavorus TaxID=349221 RepID=A0A2W5PLT7_9BACT|nr:MAG: hypothetical protein DI551_06910 [Micavibrio aeruginosavorus]